MQYDSVAMFQSVAACAAKGWKIVRLWGVRNNATCTCGREACPTPGKHPAGGAGWQHRATDNEEEIARWFDAAGETENARCNVGIRLGPTSGVVDVEFDNPEAEEVLKSFGLDLIDTPAYSSGRGVHRLFEHEDWMPNSAVVKVNGLEVRIGGGEQASQSVIPPSWHRSGVQYQWLPGKSPEEVSPAKLPPEFREAVLAASRKQSGGGVIAQSRDSLRADEKIGEGGRHAFLVGMASRQASRVRDFTEAERAEIVQILLALNGMKCDPPKGRDEVVKVAFDQFAYYRDKQIERRARRPYEQFGLEWNAEDRCWGPGSWSLTIVHSDPRVYKLRVPNLDKSLPPYVIALDTKQFQSGGLTAGRIMEVTGRINMNDPSPKRWNDVWIGISERDENGHWTHIRGLSARLLEDADDEFPPPEQSALCSNFTILLAYLSDFAMVESADNAPNPNGTPKWVFKEGRWELWLQWRVTVNAAWKRAGLQNPSHGERQAMLSALRHAISPNDVRKCCHRFDGGRFLKAFVFSQDLEIAAIERLSEGK